MGVTLYLLIRCTNVSGEEPTLKMDLTYASETSRPLHQTINSKYIEDGHFKSNYSSYGGHVCSNSTQTV
jgi:hypothetical protein